MQECWVHYEEVKFGTEKERAWYYLQDSKYSEEKAVQSIASIWYLLLEWIILNSALHSLVSSLMCMNVY